MMKTVKTTDREMIELIQTIMDWYSYTSGEMTRILDNSDADGIDVEIAGHIVSLKGVEAKAFFLGIGVADGLLQEFPVRTVNLEAAHD